MSKNDLKVCSKRGFCKGSRIEWNTRQDWSGFLDVSDAYIWFRVEVNPFRTGKSSDQVTESLWFYTKQGLLAKGFLLPTLSTSIFFTCFWIDLVPTRVSDDRKHVFGRRLYARINTRKFKASIPEKLHHCQRSKNWFTWHVISIIFENKPHYYINTNEIYQVSFRAKTWSSYVKITCYLHMWKYQYHLCYGYIINRAFHTKKTIKVKWFGILLVFI